MTMEEARGLVATAWCDEPNRHTVMDTNLAESFAKILKREIEKAEMQKRPEYGYGASGDTEEG